MRRRTVLLPLPLDPSRTKSSPSPISSEKESTTRRPAKSFVMFSRMIDMRLSGPLRAARVSEEEEEDQERKSREHGGDRVGLCDVAGFEPREDVEGGGLSPEPQVSGDHH